MLREKFMLTLPLVLGMILAGTGIMLITFCKSDCEKWIGFRLLLAGCLLVAENVITRIFPSIDAFQPGIYIITLCIISINVLVITFRYL